MGFCVTSDRDEKYLLDHGADPDRVYRWRLACEAGIYHTVREAVQAGLDLIPLPEKIKD